MIQFAFQLLSDKPDSHPANFNHRLVSMKASCIQASSEESGQSHSADGRIRMSHLWRVMDPSSVS